MDIDKHIIVAAIAAQQQGRNINHVYDYGRGKYIPIRFNTTKTPKSISMFDFNRNSYVVGTLPSVYDYASKAYINIRINGNKFNGYDYESNSYFSGVVNGGLVNIYDYQNGRYFNYGV